MFELLHYYSWIVDRFHLSTRAWQATAGRADPDFAWLEDRLAALDFRIILCQRPAESFAAAREERLKVSGNPSQYDDLDVFVREQELLDRLARASRLQVLRLDVSGGDIAGAADTVADWLAATGGLTTDQ